MLAAQTWLLGEVDQKCLEGFEMWCWCWMEKISWTDHVRNGEVLHRMKGERHILHAVKRSKATWIGHCWCNKCRLKHVIEGRLEGMIEEKRRGGRGHQQLLDDLKET